MTIPYAPIWLQPATPGMLSNRRGSNQTNDAIILKTRYSNPNSADRPGTFRATASRTTIAGVPASVPQSVWDSGFVGNISSTAFPYTTSVGGVVAPVGPNSIAQASKSSGFGFWTGRVYVLVADQRTTDTNHVGVIYSAPVGGNGTVGAWRLESAPAGTSGEICNPGALTIINGQVYILTNRTIWNAQIQGDGTLANWQDQVFAGEHEFGALVFPSHPTMMAGYDATGWSTFVVLNGPGPAPGFLVVFDGTTGVCYKYMVDNDGDVEGLNSADTGVQATLPAARSYAAIHIDDAGFITVIGGESAAGTPASTVYWNTCAVSTNGAIGGTWQASGTPLPQARSRMAYSAFYKVNNPRSGVTQFVSAPAAPTLTPQAGSTGLPAGSYTVVATYITPNGETSASTSTNATLTAGQQLLCQESTALPGNATFCNFYLTVAPGGVNLGAIGGSGGSTQSTTLTSTTQGNGVSAPTVNTTDAMATVVIAGGIQASGGAGQTTIYSLPGDATVTTTNYNLGWKTASHPLTSALALGGGMTLEWPGAEAGLGPSIGEDPPYAEAVNGHPLYIVVGGGITTPLIASSDDSAAITSGNTSSLSAGVLGTGGAVVVNPDGTVDVTFQFNAFGPLSWLSSFSDGDQVQFTAQFTDFNAGQLSPTSTTVINIGQPPTLSSIHPVTPGDTNISGSPQVSFQYTPGGGGGIQSTWRSQIVQRYADTILADTPTGYWHLDSTGATEADASGNGNGGTYTGTVTRSVTGALQTDSDKAITPDGSTGYLDFGTVPALYGLFQNHDFSVEFWEKHASTPGSSQYLIYCGLFNSVSSDQAFHMVYGPSGQIRLDFFSDGLYSPNVQPVNQWNHIVATWKASTGQRNIYVNGVLDSTGLSNASLNVPNGSDFTIGRATFGTGNGPFFFGGSLDELAVYNYVLTPKQVLGHYNQGFLNTCVSIADSGVHLDNSNLFAPNIAPRLLNALTYGHIVTVTSADSPMSTNDSATAQVITFFQPGYTQPIDPVNASVAVDSTLMAVNITATVPAPTAFPNLSDGGAASTPFHAGNFQLVYTWLMADGTESPPGPPGQVTLTAGHQISVGAITGLPNYVNQIKFYAISVPTGDSLGLIAFRSVSANTMNAFNIIAEAGLPLAPGIPWFRVLHRRSGTTTWIMLADNLMVVPGAALTFGPFMDQLAWGATYDFAVQTANAQADSAIVVAGTSVAIPITPALGGAGMLHVAGNGANQNVRLFIQGGVKVTTKLDAQAAEVFGVSAPTLRYGVLKYHQVEAKVNILDVATMKALQAVRDQAMTTGATLYWRDSAGHVLAVGFQPEIGLEHFGPSYLAQRPTTLKLVEIPNTFSPSTTKGQVRGNFQQVNGTIVPLDPGEVAA